MGHEGVAEEEGGVEGEGEVVEACAVAVHILHYFALRGWRGCVQFCQFYRFIHILRIFGPKLALQTNKLKVTLIRAMSTHCCWHHNLL